MYLIRKVKDVIFYYPQHFNRSEVGTNSFFEPLILLCEKNNWSYLLIEEPDRNTDKPSNPIAKKFGLFLFLILALRKIVPLFLFDDFESRELVIGKAINILSLGRLRAKNYITLSNSMGGVLKGINPNARIFDYQHGIITSTQPGYFQNKKAPKWIFSTNKEVLVYGNGFRDIMLATDKDYYTNKVHVIGVPDTKSSDFVKGEQILVSLQLLETEDVSIAWLNAQVEMLENLFINYAKSSQLTHKTIYLKHHPRSNRSFDIGKLFVFPFVKEFDNSAESCQIGLHITFFSTTAFEFAALGIPTLFLFNDVIPQGETLFFREFKYPYQKCNTIEAWLIALNSKESKQITIGMLKWYSAFYEPFNEKKMIKLITSK